MGTEALRFLLMFFAGWAPVNPAVLVGDRRQQLTDAYRPPFGSQGEAARPLGPPATLTAVVVDYMQLAAARPGIEFVETRLDADRAIKITESMEGKVRLAVLLTTRPTVISDDDWRLLVENLPPPLPSRVSEAIDRDEASMILYPPRGPDETMTARYQRLKSFDKTYNRASSAFRAALEGGE